MKDLILISGASYAALAVIFGAFGAHALKKILPVDLLNSFETGVRYQMYHALALLLFGSALYSGSSLQQISAWCFLLGTFLFSFSIYGLCLSAARGRKFRFLGPVTPLGGLLLVLGWVFLLASFL